MNINTLDFISAQAFTPEKEAVEQLLNRIHPLDNLEVEIIAHATSMVEKARARGLGVGVEAFLQQYGLDTVEGIALMCLAEALLRIPDTETANRLIRDKFEGAHWENYVGNSESLFVNASSWGLMLTGKVINMPAEHPASVFARMVGKCGEPVIREALKHSMKFIGSQFVLGETIEEALANARKFAKQGYCFSYDILGEGARSDAQALGYVQAYHHAIGLIADHAKNMGLFEAPSISVKLSALHPRYSYTQKDRVLNALLPRLKAILLAAKAAGITVSLDAEEATRLDIELLLFETIFCDPEFAGWNGLGFVVQAYQKRAPYVIEWLAALAKRENKILPIRLVKGAYWDSEIKWSQVMGLPGYPVFTRKEYTDLSYLACADLLLANAQQFYPQFATHNARTIASIQALARHYHVGKDAFEFQRLHGMGENIHGLLVKDYASRVYAPVGAHKDLLAYLIRRLLENGANTSFVNLLMDKSISTAALLANPVTQTREVDAMPNPHIPLPNAIYASARKNSAGVDPGNVSQMHALKAALAPYDRKEWKASSLVAVADAHSEPAESTFNPAKRDEKVGECTPLPQSMIEAVVLAGRKGVAEWAKLSVSARADIMRRVADGLEENAAEFIALCTREAGKTVLDGIAEVREAADFCRYYAAEAARVLGSQTLQGPTGESNVLEFHPRGVFVCISPWNFPLAIFMGQVVAALMGGNAVIAKPAEQTPLIAYRAVELMHAAGIPKAALQLVIGAGETIGAALISNTNIAGVVFTGSGETARRIQHSLSSKTGPIVPFIAETGGQNCMVVDSSALLEQAVDDVVLSAFGSAGQRCSALRVLFVQEDIADALLEILRGAMAELKLGDPAELATDIGPVIDEEARTGLLGHIERMKKEAKTVATAPLSEILTHEGTFVAPVAFEITSLDMLTREIFGPVLHIIRFKATELHALPAQINASGYGLTFGIHSRIEDHVQFFTRELKAGNIYVNRSMIGATVGVQPFGGEGLSGTGPKAGGPLYLLRFVTERTVTINVAAIGGNVSLLSA